MFVDKKNILVFVVIGIFFRFLDDLTTENIYFTCKETKLNLLFSRFYFLFLRSLNIYGQKMKPALLFAVIHSKLYYVGEEQAIDKLSERNHDIKRSQLWFAPENNKTSDQKENCQYLFCSS
jgi:hypothetical protein